MYTSYVDITKYTPTVSIIVPTYRRNEKFLTRALDSLLAQTYDNIEIIVVDDNADERNSEYRAVVKKTIDGYNSDKIVYVKNEKSQGGAIARNTGVTASCGQYITFLDDDDKYLPNKVKKQLQYMLDNELEMSFTDLRIHNGYDRLVDYREHSKIKSFDNEDLLKYHLTRQISGTPTFMYQKEAFCKIGGFIKVSMGQEYHLMFKTIEAGLKIGYLRGSDVVAYREGQECISSGQNKVTAQKTLYDFKRTYFNILSHKQRRFVSFRHRAVMIVAYKRNRQTITAIAKMFSIFFLHPINCFREFFSFFRRINKYNNME